MKRWLSARCSYGLATLIGTLWALTGCRVEERAYGIGFSDMYSGDDDVIFFEPDIEPVEIGEGDGEREARAREILDNASSDGSTLPQK